MVHRCRNALHISISYFAILSLSATHVEASSSHRRLSSRRQGHTAVYLRSEGSATVIDSSQRNSDLLPGYCYSHADCQHSGICDETGEHGCQNRCVSVKDAQNVSYCMTKAIAEGCNHDGECLSYACDTAGLYGCQNLCLSEMSSAGRHCRVKDMGSPCTHSNQCLSGVCDIEGRWDCKDLCVSDLDANGKNRHCDKRRAGETCVHDVNCGSSFCDLNGTLEDGRCNQKCATASTPECPRQHCSPDCDVCLSNLLTHPLVSEGSEFGQWRGYPERRVQRSADSHSIHMLLNESENTHLHMRLSPSCVAPLPCIEVNGTMEVVALDGARLSLETGMYTGFPGDKPSIDILLNGQCPIRSDGFPVAGDIGCCYTSQGNCSGAPYDKSCESFYLGSFSYSNNWLSWDHRSDTDTDSFDQGTTQQHFPLGGNVHTSGHPTDFSLRIDFSAEKYRYFKMGDKSWSMDEELMKFSRDRNCNHIREWPKPAFEFRLKLTPITGSTVINADVKLTHLEVSRRPDCSA